MIVNAPSDFFQAFFIELFNSFIVKACNCKLIWFFPDYFKNISCVYCRCRRLPRDAYIASFTENLFPSESIKKKDGSSLVGNMAAQGTTPRQLTDLIGSLCDLTSGSGDKGTPVVLVQGYFDNYTN